MDIFTKPGDFESFIKLLEEGRRRFNMRILGYILMDNHWHLALWPRRGPDLAGFMQWVSTTHVRRWREHRGNVGQGHLYQGRFKSFIVQNDAHLLSLMIYIESNALRARMVKHAEDWPWSACETSPARMTSAWSYPVGRWIARGTGNGVSIDRWMKRRWNGWPCA